MSNSIRLDNRLLTIASLVNNCNTLIDVGTDHGYLPIYLIQNNIVKKVIASDVAINPLNKALDNIIKYNLEGKIETKLANGLINQEYADFVVIAGMGGNLIIDILNKKEYDYPYYILQANINVPLLRKYLTENNYKIIDEKIAFCNKKFYEIIKTAKGHQMLNEIEIEYGPINLKNKDPLFIKKLENEINKYETILTDFKGSYEEELKIKSKIKQIKIAMEY